MRICLNLFTALCVCCIPLSVHAQHAAVLETVSSTTQGRPAGSVVAAPPVVRVRDQQNNPLPGVEVVFALTTGDGSIAPSTVTTGADGTARVTSWQLGNTPGWNTMTASVRHLEPLTFKIYGGRVPTTIRPVTSPSPTGSPGAQVADPPAVIIRDQFGLPMEGEVVKFGISGGQVFLSLVVDTTGADGIARLSSWTLSPTAGQNLVVARSLGLQGEVRFVVTTPFTLTATAKRTDGTAIQNSQICVGVPTSLDWYAKVKSGGTSGQATFTLPVYPVYSVTASKGGFIGQTTSYTPVGGSAAIALTLQPGTGGPVCPGAAIEVDASAQVPIPIERKPTTITPVLGAGSGYGWTAGTLLTYAPAMTVVVRDQFGQPLPGVNVSFSVTSGGGSLTPSSVMTGADGSARPTSWMLGSTPGLNTANAVVTGLAAAVLSVSGNLVASSVQAATTVTQTAAAASRAAISPGVLVKDQFGNAMQGVSVTFAIASGDGSVTPTNPVPTGVDGIARATSWMVGSKGPSVVKANVVRLPAVSFTAEVAEPFTLIAYAKGLDGNGIPSATICVGSGRELAAFGVKSADANGRAIFTLPAASQYAVTAANPGYTGKTVLFPSAGNSGNVTITLATGLIGATCSPLR